MRLLMLFLILLQYTWSIAQPPIYNKNWIDFNKNGTKDIFEDPTKTDDERAMDLLGKMTIEEKNGQMLTAYGWPMYERNGNTIDLTSKFKSDLASLQLGSLWGLMRADPWTQKTFANGLNPSSALLLSNKLQKYVIENTRLGIPILLAEECPHGHMAIGTTVFPTSIGQASTWNPELIKQMAETIAQEARSQGVHVGYGPILDLARDPRWSRVEETYGEDSYLVGQMGKAIVEGFQGNNLKDLQHIGSTLKHFAGYGWTEGGHNGGTAHIGEREQEEFILPPFKAAIDAGAIALMSSYNEMDGTPCTSNKVLLTDILRTRWGFRGFVVSDLFAINGLMIHGVAGNLSEAAIKALSAGVDADLGIEAYAGNITNLVKSGKLKEDLVNKAVLRILKVKFSLGLFDNPILNESITLTADQTSTNHELAREVARQSITLLKNKENLLPLQKNLRSIAVIGPNADNVYNMLGDYTATQLDNDVVTVLEGIRNKVSCNNTVINYAKGSAIRDTSSSDMQKAIEVAQKSELIILVMGGSSARDFSSQFETTGAAKVVKNAVSDMEAGEGYDRSTLELMGRQLELMAALKKLGKPMVLVLIKGRPLILNWCNDNIDAIVDAWYPGMQGGNAIADVLFGDCNPAGRLPISVPKSVGQLPVFYNTKRNANRHDYIEESASPLFEFGYGLSYTSFDYSNLVVTAYKANSKVLVSVDVANVGSYDGEDVVQLYIKDHVATFTRPEKELKAFKRVKIKKGEKTSVKFDLNASDFELYMGNGTFKVEHGEFSIMVGKSSSNIILKKTIEL